MTEHAAEGTVLFRPLAENLDTETRRGIMAPQRMTDHGDYVEWTNGRKTWRWHLPDQMSSSAPYPIMTTVVLGECRSPIAPGDIASYYIAFTDAAGNVLGRLRGGLIEDVGYPLFDAALPPAAWQPLLDRGVRMQRELVVGLAPFHRRHPDPSLRRVLGVWRPVRGARAAEAARLTGLVTTHGASLPPSRLTPAVANSPSRRSRLRFR